MADILKALNNKPGFFSLKGATNEQIQKAESELGLTFSKDYRDYVAAFGAAIYEGHELTGIVNSSRLNVVNVTLEERENNPNIPTDWYVLEQLHIDDVTIWQTEEGEVYQVLLGAEPVKIHDSLIAYIEE